ncbi:MAG: terminase large subunit [Oscillospiraceae bacterium]|nr:terminase large subunit [Oscillospiraceae bacterium]
MEEFRYLKNYKPSRFKAEGCIYKQKFADHAVFFVNNLKHTTGKWCGQDFLLINWQERIIRDIFGIVHRGDECRQFRRAYIEVPIKNGKSTFAAAIALLLTLTDLEYGGEIYLCTGNAILADNMFSMIETILNQLKIFNRYITVDSELRKFTFRPLRAFLQVIDSKQPMCYGINAHSVIFDGLSNMNRQFYESMTAGTTLAREQPLILTLTSAGNDSDGICCDLRQYSRDVLSGAIANPTFYSSIFAADSDDDWTDEVIWRKANPSLGIIVPIERMRREFAEAQQNPRYETWFKKNLLGMAFA